MSGGNQNVSFAVKYKENLYEVPVDGISLSEITRALNVNTLNSAYLIIQMETIERSQLGMPTVSNGVSISTLVDPIEIRIVVINGSGSANGGANINHSGKYYLRMNGSRVTSAQSTLVNYNTSINAMEHMLSSTSGSNGNLLYTAKVEGNSIIGPIMGSIFYSDINSHWAKADINELTSKLVVGPRSTGAITFDANRNITRGEFGEYIAKALGLKSDITSNSFPDVSANTRGGYINSAVKAGIITGYPDGTFKPEQFITREQMALMMVRAMSYAKENITLNGTAAQTLSRFRDASGIQDKETVAKAVQSGIIQGMSATSFQPKGNATRAQAVVMIRRVLSKINYL
ncbi:Endoglucanase precursor [compost metagenome]